MAKLPKLLPIRVKYRDNRYIDIYRDVFCGDEKAII